MAKIRRGAKRASTTRSDDMKRQEEAYQNEAIAARGELMDNPECMCCPMMDVCTVDPGISIFITTDMINRSNCAGGFVHAFE